MKINWTVRIKNWRWWLRVVVAILTPVLTYFGLNWADFTTWGFVWETLKNVFSNPFLIGVMVIAAVNIIEDPTTKGFGDSERALTYDEPK